MQRIRPWTGPTATDKGDWLIGFLIRNLTGQTSAIAATCFAGCSYAGYSDATCDSTCHTDQTQFTFSVSFF